MREYTFRYNKKEGEELDKIIQESYEDFVRLERRNLLAASSVLLLSIFSGLNPSSGSIFGFSFNNLNEITYYSIVAVIILYFLSAFIIYGIPSFNSSRKSRKNILENSGTITYRAHIWSISRINIWKNAKYYGWIFIHFILPVMLGVVSFLLAVIKIA